MALFTALIFCFSALMAQAGEGANAGFVNGLWFSRSPFFAGETVRLYAALQNNSSFDIKGKAVFFDKNEKMGESAFSVVNGRLLEVWTDWRVTEGNHAISVSITEAFKVEVGQDPESITLTFASFTQEPLMVDNDTDGDRIGDKSDTDDDNDGLSDREEKEYSTNPLAADSDSDGVSDKKEISSGNDPLKAIKQKKESGTEKPTISLHGVASTTVAFARDAYRASIPRARETTRKAADFIDDRADHAAKIIRTKKDNLAPTQYQSLFFVSLALLLPFVEHWRIAAAIFAVILLWLLWRRLRI